MKIYKKSLFVVGLLSTFSLMAAESKIIKVTNFSDDDNKSKCSLRQAIQTAYENKSVAGCNAGNTLPGQRDYIQLEAGEYVLTQGELTPSSPVILYGELPFDEQQKDDLKGDYPKQLALKTTINAKGQSRIFNTSQTKASLTLNNLALVNGQANVTSNDRGNGGALFIGGSLELYNSSVSNSTAGGKGGAIYFAAGDQNQSLSIVRTLLKANKAPQGSVWSMDCNAKFSPVTSSTNVTQSSIVENGDANSLSAIDVCGSTGVEISNSTIAKNKANSTTGSIISYISTPNRELYDGSLLSLVSNTVVENDAASTLLYDKFGTKLLISNVLAFNGGENCRYSMKATDAKGENVSLVASNNAMAANCFLPAPPETETTKTEAAKNMILADNAAINHYLSGYKAESAYNLYLPLYYPVNHGTETDFVDAGHQSCNSADQRGFSRLLVTKLILDPTAINSCDIGSVELMRLAASDITALKNSSYSNLITAYENMIERLKAMQKDDANKSSLLQIEAELKDVESLLANTKKYAKYRAIYIDPFELALPVEETTSNGELKLKALNADNYTVTVRAKGVGQIVEGGDNPYSTQADPAQKCEWVPELKRIMFYRTDRKITDSTLSELCEYTLTEIVKNGASAKSSSGVLIASFVNIAPVAKNDTYTINPESNLSVKVNPLSNDFDDDGPVSGTETYYSDTPIRFESIDSGLIMTAEREGPCPDKYIRDTCYGGEISFKVKNNLSQFDYQATYNYFDADGGMSNTATILLKNSAKNTNESSSGGGAFGIWGLLGLVALGAYRQRRMQK